MYRIIETRQTEIYRGDIGAPFLKTESSVYRLYPCTFTFRQFHQIALLCIRHDGSFEVMPLFTQQGTKTIVGSIFLGEFRSQSETEFSAPWTDEFWMFGNNGSNWVTANHALPPMTVTQDDPQPLGFANFYAMPDRIVSFDASTEVLRMHAYDGTWLGDRSYAGYGSGNLFRIEGTNILFRGNWYTRDYGVTWQTSPTTLANMQQLQPVFLY